MEDTVLDKLLELAKQYEKENNEIEMIKCYNKAYKGGYYWVMNTLGLYYQEKNNYKESIKCFKKAIKMGDECAMYNLATYYKGIKDIKNAKKYFKLLSEKGDADGLYELGSIYLKEGNDEEATKHYLLAINNDKDYDIQSSILEEIENSYLVLEQYNKMENKSERLLDCKEMILYIVGEYFRKNIGDKLEAVKYYKMAAEKGSELAMYRIGNFYQRNKDYEESIKYYKMAIENNNYESIYRLARLYHKKYKNEEEALKYYFKFIDSMYYCLRTGLIVKCFNEIKNKFYIYKFMLEHLKNKDLSDEKRELYKELDKILSTNNEIMLYKNKIIYSKKYNTIDKCPICLEDKLMITLCCSHPICADCYLVDHDKCYFSYCKIIKNNDNLDNKFYIVDNKKNDYKDDTDDYMKYYNEMNHDSDDDTIVYSDNNTITESDNESYTI